MSKLVKVWNWKMMLVLLLLLPMTKRTNNAGLEY